MPCYECGKIFVEPTEICIECGIHLLKKGKKCSDYTECVNDEENKKCKGCDECHTYKGCGFVCKIDEPPKSSYNYPDCYCACIYAELSSRSNPRNPIKPNPYYATCHGCCSIYDMCYYTRYNSDNPKVRLAEYNCHIPTDVSFRYDITYAEQLFKDTLYNRKDKSSRSKLHMRLETKERLQRNFEIEAERAEERANRRSMDMAQGLANYDGPTRSNVIPNFGILRDK